jgi:hypothetical protein
MTRPTRTFVSFAMLCVAPLLLTAGPRASQEPPLPDVLKLGPQVGERVPDFALNDQRGRSRSLASLMGPRGLMLVFYRSADW